MNFKKRLDKIEEKVISSSQGKTIRIDNLKNLLLYGDGQLPKNVNIVCDEEFIKQKYAKSDNGNLDPKVLSDTFLPLLQRSDELKHLANDIENERNTIKVKIKDAIGDHRYAICGGRKLQWKKAVEESKTIFNEELFKTDNPQIWKKYLIEVKEHGSQYFRI